MKRRITYFAAFLGLLSVEIYIGLFVRDAFVRPYVGDVLVTVLLCTLSRAVFPEFNPALPVFLFAAAVEAAQCFGLAERLGLRGTVLGVIIGSTFDVGDLVCYAAGCAIFALVEWAMLKITLKRG